MVEISSEFNKRGYEILYNKLLALYSRNELRKVIYRAARRAAQSGVTAIKREISSQTTMKSSTVLERVKEYTYGGPTQDFAIGIKIDGTPRPLSEFKFLPKMPKPNAFPTVEIYKGKKQRVSDGAFVQKMPSGHIGVFKRQSEKRLPIKELIGPSVAGLFMANENIHDTVWNTVFETFEKRVLPELNFALNLENK